MNEIKGLTWKEATKALRVHGHNEVTGKKINLLLLLLSQFKSPVVIILLIASILSLFQGSSIKFLIVLLIFTLNITISFVQAYRSKNTYQNLEKLVTIHVLALRNGEQVLVDKTTIVPGDIIFLKKGDIVCADAYVLEQSELSVNESNITGSDSAINKKVNLKMHKGQKDGVVYSGSQVLEGTCIAKVFATGEKSKYSLPFSDKLLIVKSNYENSLKKISNYLMAASTIVLAIVFILNILVKQEHGIVNIVLFTLALVIAFIPESLSIIANLTITKTALQLSNKQIIIKNNNALEKIGDIDVICTDIAGTITLNKLKIDFFHSVIDKDDFFKYSYLSTVENVDLLDKCIFSFLKENNVQDQSEFMIEEIPFNSKKKFSARKFKDFEIIKGAPEYIFGITSKNKPEERELIEQNIIKGLQAISFAIKDKHGTKYIGSYFFYDEIKNDADSVIKASRSLGMTIKIITKDSKEVSAFIAQKVGLISSFDEVIIAENLDFSNQEKLFDQLTKHSVFACCNSEQKFKILECLKTKHYIGYLGEGIEDSHSLAIANVGIAINTASDIAKQQSDIVLLSNDLKVVIEGIKQSRIAFENIDKYLKNTLTGSFGNIFSIGLISPFVRFLPMLPIQIFISNLLTNVPLLALANDNVDLDKLKSPKDHSLNKAVKFAFIFGIISTAFDLIFFYLVRNQLPSSVQTQWFVLTVLTEVAILFSLRTRKSFLANKVKASKVLSQLSILSILVTLLLAIFGLPGVFEGLSLTSLSFVIIVAAVYFVFNELVKTPIIRLLKL